MVGANLLAGIWGGIAWLRHEPSVIFWYLLRIAQGLVIVQVGIGLYLLVGQSKSAPDGLHVLYGIAPLAVALATEAMRVGATQRELEEVEDLNALDRREQAEIARRVVLREMGVMSIGTLLIVTLSLRALSTGL
jgi:hypothetical protein